MKILRILSFVMYAQQKMKTTQAVALEYSMASKILATESAFKGTNQAVQICGGMGLSQEYVIEKIFRMPKWP